MTQPGPEAVIFDLDGTVYRGDHLIPGAAQAITSLRESGTEVLFLTNKAIERRQTYSQKLTELGVSATRDEVINSGWVTGRYLQKHHPEKLAYVVGEDPLVEELTEAGIDVTTEDPGELVVASMDRTFGYEKLDLALQSMTDETPFVATNPDRTCPTAYGEIPDAAGMIGAIEGVTGRSVDAILGKPSATMVETVMGVLDVDPTRCMMVGDRPETDIKMGERAGMNTALVLSGVTDRSGVADLAVSPTHVLDSIAELPEVLGMPRTVTDE